MPAIIIIPLIFKISSSYEERYTKYRFVKQWIVESIFSAIKKMFEKEARSKKRYNIIQELMLSVVV